MGRQLFSPGRERQMLGVKRRCIAKHIYRQHVFRPRFECGLPNIFCKFGGLQDLIGRTFAEGEDGGDAGVGSLNRCESDFCHRFEGRGQHNLLLARIDIVERFARYSC